MGGGHSSSKSKSKSKGGKKPHSIHIRRGKSGGFISEHHFLPDEDGMTPPSEEHVQPDMASLQAHVADQMGDQGPAPAPAPDPAAAAAAAAAPAPAPAAPGGL